MPDKTDKMDYIRKLKATWWSITAYNTEGKSQNIDKLEDMSTWPDKVKVVYGGREIGKKEGRLHFQAAVQFVCQVRGSYVLDWLPGAHIEAARNAGDLKLYAMKSDTAVGEKTEVANTHAIPYMTTDKILYEITKWLMSSNGTNIQDYASEEHWWLAVNDLLMRYPQLAGNFLNKQLMNLWLKTIPAWKHNVSKGEGLPV